MRRLALLTVFMLALLPLRWFKLISTPLGALYVHELGLLVLAIVVVATVSGRVLALARDSTLVFTALMAAGFAVWTASCLFYGASLASTIKQVVYLGCFVAVVAVFILIAESRDQRAIRLLRWAGLVTTCTLLAALLLSLVVNHVSPASVLAAAAASGDPTTVESQLFRPAFAGFGYTDAQAVSQLRHEVFAGLLVSLLVSSWAQHRAPLRSTLARWTALVTVVVAGLLILLSLSRSIQLAALAWPLLAGLRTAARGRLTRRTVVSLAIVAAVGVAVVVTGLFGVVVARITTDSSSYTVRGARLGAAVGLIEQYPWSGGHYDDSISSHNFVLDAWLRGGILMAVLMLAVVVLVAGQLLANVLTVGAAPAWLVPVTAALVLPLVRMFTIGAGLLTPPEWVSLALGMAGTVVYRRERAARAAQRATGAPQPEQSQCSPPRQPQPVAG